MDAATLRATQAPIKDRYKTDPKAAFITLKAKGSVEGEGITCRLETGRALADAGLEAFRNDAGLTMGLNVHRGRLTSVAVASSLSLEFCAPERALAG